MKKELFTRFGNPVKFIALADDFEATGYVKVCHADGEEVEPHISELKGDMAEINAAINERKKS